MVTCKTDDGDFSPPLAWEDCKWMALCGLTWQAKEVPRQYGRSWGCILVPLSRFCSTAIEWWDKYMYPLKFEECPWKDWARKQRDRYVDLLMAHTDVNLDKAIYQAGEIQKCCRVLALLVWLRISGRGAGRERVLPVVVCCCLRCLNILPCMAN